MFATRQHNLFGIVCCSLLQAVLAVHVFQGNGTDSANPLVGQETDFIAQALNEKLTTLDYYFFSYDIIDHVTLLVKFDLSKSFLFQPNETLYRAYLYVSKLPSTNYKIDIGPFTGYYEKDLHGSIMDHFTFCLVLTPNRRHNQTGPNPFRFLRRSSREQRQQYIMHYCTKMGPDEDRHRHHVKQGSEGDRILLVLQLMMIGIILAILQVAHVIRNRKKRTWRMRRLNRIRRELLHRKQYIEMPNETLAMLRFIPILDPEPREEIDDPETEDEGEGEDDEEEEEEGGDERDEEDSLILSHRTLPRRPIMYQRSRSPSPNPGRMPVNVETSCAEHILSAKPWLCPPH